jgi:hypothetical protein
MGSECLNRRCSVAFGIIAGMLFLPDVVLIGQLRVYLAIGVEILDCKPTEYINIG